MPLQPAAKYPQKGAWASGWGEIAGTAMEIFPINRSYFRHVSHVIVVCIRTSSPAAPSPRNLLPKLYVYLDALTYCSFSLRFFLYFYYM